MPSLWPRGHTTRAGAMTEYVPVRAVNKLAVRAESNAEIMPDESTSERLAEQATARGEGKGDLHLGVVRVGIVKERLDLAFGEPHAFAVAFGVVFESHS